MEKLSFTTNWNNKLLNDHFTTIRYSSPKYRKGQTFQVFLKGVFMYNAEVIDVQSLKLSKINDWIAYLDTGYNAEATREILTKMYQANHPDPETIPLVWVLLKKIV